MTPGEYDSIVDQEQENEYQPWYRVPTNEHPFKLVRKFALENNDAPAFRSLAIFPWDSDSLSKLWQGSLDTPENQAPWKNLVSEYWDAVAVTSDYCLYVFFTQKKRAPLCVKLPQDAQKILPNDVMCVAWALDHTAPFQPLIIFSRGSVLFIYNPERMGISGYLRGHGGAITSISVHPTTAHLFSTTSRDYTTRIYDLTLPAEIPVNDPQATTSKKKDEKVPNPHWPPGNKPSMAGAAHGLRLPFSEVEGRGMGRCVCVLMGGRSGGHQAAVLGAAFHPSFPVIATCGMDRTVKIWPVRPNSQVQIKREDKPLFTTSMIHKARVLSISWLQDDLLLTHSAPAIVRVEPLNAKNKATHIEPGELIIWRWLGLDRFFPADQQGVPPAVLRGVSSDYQESSSFNIISIHAFPPVSSPFVAPNLSLFQSPTHDPLILFVYPKAFSFSMLNASHMSARAPPPFPREAQQLLQNNTDPADPPQNAAAAADAADSAALASATAEHLHLSGGGDEDDVDVDEDEEARRGEQEAEEEERISGFVNRRAEIVPPGIVGWTIGVEDEDEEDGRGLMSCAMGLGGRVVVGVGMKGSVWVWRYDG
ncbi:WD40-repeat-containing domain protein [Flammula alnicola]|nr:WD40-repeat-containing domain protein [Flammula alnicola]